MSVTIFKNLQIGNLPMKSINFDKEDVEATNLDEKLDLL